MKLLRYVLILIVAIAGWTYYSSLQKAPVTPAAPTTESGASKSGAPKVVIPTAAYMQIESAMVKVPFGSNTAGYMKITNTGQVDDRLVSVACVFASNVELHDHIDEGGVIKMRRVDNIEIPAGGNVKLAPGGKHIMFFNVQKEALQEGKTVTLNLEFANAGMIEVQCPVQPIPAVSTPTATSAANDIPVKNNAG